MFVYTYVHIYLLSRQLGIGPKRITLIFGFYTSISTTSASTTRNMFVKMGLDL